jgi:NHLM bacteriocin system ABC transporter peptidase/ATP-binding protein
VLQTEAVECGAAALGIVLAYHGRVVPLEELRHACGVSRDGSKATNIVAAAREYGLEPHAYRKEPEDLRAVRLPVIVFWEFNHFLVVEGFGKGRVYLNDPAYGPRTVTDDEFDEGFTGVTIAFDVGPAFRKGGRSASLTKALLAWLRGSGADVAYAVLAGLCLLLPGLLVPTFVRVFVDRVLVQGMSEWMPVLLAAMAGTLLLQGALVWLQQTRLLWLGQRLTLAAASRLMWHILRLPAEFFALRYVGDVASRLLLTEQVGHFLSSELAPTALNAVLIGVYVLLMLRYSVALTVTGVGLSLLNFAALQHVSRRRIDVTHRLQQERGKLLSTAFGGLRMIETLKATGGEDGFFARWAGYQAKLVSAQQELGVYSQYLATVPPLLAALAAAAVLSVGGAQVIAGTLTIGALIGFQYLLASFADPITRLVTLGTRAQEMDVGLRRLDDVLGYPADPVFSLPADSSHPPRAWKGDMGSTNDVPSGSDQAPARLAGRLEFRGVTFGYSRLEPPLLQDFSFVLAPGARVALVGASGSGKSTVARLVCGLYEPWAGEILFDGRPRAAYSRRTLTASLALVDQDIFLFEGSVRENLTLWDPTVPDAALVAAARDACVHEIVTTRPGGYDSHIEESGANLSGGERQRLEIARALAGGPTLLVLDEATSALDPATEQQIDAALRRRGCACLIVAHRLSTIRDCDEIIVVEHGRIAQRGTHEQLLASGGAYAQLIATE